jgi:hypothetical protein
MPGELSRIREIGRSRPPEETCFHYAENLGTCRIVYFKSAAFTFYYPIAFSASRHQAKKVSGRKIEVSGRKRQVSVKKRN